MLPILFLVSTILPIKAYLNSSTPFLFNPNHRPEGGRTYFPPVNEINGAAPVWKPRLYLPIRYPLMHHGRYGQIQQYSTCSYDCISCCNCCQLCRKSAFELIFPQQTLIVHQQLKPTTREASSTPFTNSTATVATSTPTTKIPTTSIPTTTNSSTITLTTIDSTATDPTTTPTTTDPTTTDSTTTTPTITNTT